MIPIILLDSCDPEQDEQVRQLREECDRDQALFLTRLSLAGSDEERERVWAEGGPFARYLNYYSDEPKHKGWN